MTVSLLGCVIMDNMKNKLAQIEARLQALVEGGVARLFPSIQKQSDLVSRLVQAMHAGIETGSDGNPLVPNLYTLRVHPNEVDAWQDNQALLDSLSQALREAGDEAGLRFSNPPVVRVAAALEVAAGEVQISARNSQADLTQTTDIAVNRDPNAPDLPPNAFLIVDGTRIFPLDQAVVNIGRKLENQLVVEDPRVSRVHAQLRAVRNRFVIFDLDSTGGTLVNGERVHQCTLYPGDVISLSGVPLVFGQDPSVHGETQDFSPALVNPKPRRKPDTHEDRA